MQILSSLDFWMIVAIVVSALGVALTARADRHKIHRETERRREAGEQRLEGQIISLRQEMKGDFTAHKKEIADAFAAHKQEVGSRIDRLEDRIDENHREVTARLAELKAEVSALGARLDERSHPRRLVGAGLPGRGADAASGIVRETPGLHSPDESKSGATGASESGAPHPQEESRD